jgi:hypothetical protein
MSKGPGYIQRQLIDLFARKRLFRTKDLCREVFRVKYVRKKHRVAVLRALKGMAKTGKLNIWRAVEKNSRDDFWFDYDRSLRKPLINTASADKPRPRK